MRHSILAGLALLALSGVWQADAQVLGPVTGGLPAGEKRRVHILTLTRKGFEPKELKVQPGKVTILVRDLTGSGEAPFELRLGSKGGSAAVTKKRQEGWRLMEEFQFELGAGEAYLGIGAAGGPFCKLVVSAK